MSSTAEVGWYRGALFAEQQFLWSALGVREQSGWGPLAAMPRNPEGWGKAKFSIHICAGSFS